MAGGAADACGNCFAEFGRSNYLGVAAIAEDETFEFVVYDNFERQLDAAVAEALLDFLRTVEWFGFDIRCLLTVDLYDNATSLVADLTRYTDCVVEKVRGVEIHAFSE